MFSYVPDFRVYPFSKIAFVLLNLQVMVFKTSWEKEKIFGIYSLNLYHIIPTLRALRKKAFENSWEEEKMLVTIFSFLSKWFNPFPNKPWFLYVCSRSLLKTLWEKEKLLVTSNFSSSHSVFYLFGVLSAIFIKFEIVVCKVFQFGRA